jgi:hypothetical protein
MKKNREIESEPSHQSEWRVDAPELFPDEFFEDCLEMLFWIDLSWLHHGYLPTLC